MDNYKNTGRLGRISYPFFPLMLQIHISSAAIDAAVTVTLASSALFNLDVSAARASIVLSLFGTMVPFVLLAPSATLLVEKIKFPRLAIAIGINILRILGLVAMGLASAYSSTTRLAIFPIAFLMLTLSKCYVVSKTSALPQVTTRESFPYFSSRLSMSTSIVSVVAGGIFLSTNRLFSESSTLLFASCLIGAIVIFSILSYTKLLKLHQSVVSVDEAEVKYSYIENTAIKKINIDPSQLNFIIRQLFGFGCSTRFVAGAITIGIGLTYKDEKILLATCFLLATISGFITNAFASWVSKLKLAVYVEFSILFLSAISLFTMVLTDLVILSFCVSIATGSVAALSRVFYESRMAKVVPAKFNARILARGEIYMQLSWVCGAVVAVAAFSYAFVGMISFAALIFAMACLLLFSSIVERESQSPE